MATKFIDKLPIAENALSKFREQQLRRAIANFASKLDEYKTLVENFAKKIRKDKWIFMGNSVVYNHDIAALMPNLSVYKANAGKESELYKTEFLQKLKFAKFEGELPTLQEVQACFNDSSQHFRANDGKIQTKDCAYFGLSCMNQGEFWYMFTQNSYKYKANSHGNYTYNEPMATIPVFRFNGVNSKDFSPAQAILCWLEHDLMPLESVFGSKADKVSFDSLKNFYATIKSYLKADEDAIVLDCDKLFEEIMHGSRPGFLPEAEKILTSAEINGDEAYEKGLHQALLECDQKRAELDPYDPKLLLDPKRGHWALWNYACEGAKAGEVILKQPLVARDPATDVNRNIVAIDFGTKSTVVVFENEHSETLPLQVGSGNYGEGVVVANYENPTILQFIDIESFMAAYRAREGRPETSWEDVTVSHRAFDNMLHSSSSVYSSFFSGVKSWCGTRDERKLLVDGKGHRLELPPYADLLEGDLDPLEIYAYYLGLYINNMMQEGHIFLRYVLSFPVTYEYALRERMRASFEAGIRKSFPTTLLANEAVMRDFRVSVGESEPAAYAITALQEYGFDPGEGEENYYAVLDFGGGTTDFDFGVLREAELDRYDYTLLHFGENGDRTLGGENLLRLMAFKVFKANSDKLLKPNGVKQPDAKADTDANANAETDTVECGKIPFTWAAEKEDFPGSMALIKDSQEAHANMHNLMEALRPIWEAPESEKAQGLLSSGEVKVDLFTDTGKQRTGFSLKLDIGAFPDLASEEIDALGQCLEQAAWGDKKEKSKCIAADANVSEIIGFLIDCLPREISETLSAMQAANSPDYLEDIYENNGIWGLFDLAEIGYEVTQTSCEGSGWNLSVDSEGEMTYIRCNDNVLEGGTPQVSSATNAVRHSLRLLLARRIDDGVRRFFLAMREAFAKNARDGAADSIRSLTQIDSMSIFLAGNSAKSALVKSILARYTEGDKPLASQILGLEGKMPHFEIFPPLGTPEAYDRLEDLHKQHPNRVKMPVRDRLENPTGKTGVAFGLLRCREGGLYQVKNLSQPDQQDSFQLYVGRQKKRRFRTVLDRTAPMLTWVDFIDAGGDFDLYYSDRPEAAFNEMDVTLAKRVTLTIGKPRPDARIFVRPIGPRTIEYTVADTLEAISAEGPKPEPIRVELV